MNESDCPLQGRIPKPLAQSFFTYQQYHLITSGHSSVMKHSMQSADLLVFPLYGYV